MKLHIGSERHMQMDEDRNSNIVQPIANAMWDTEPNPVVPTAALSSGEKFPGATIYC